MKTNTRRAALICVTLTMLCGCGKQHKAENTVKDFLENNMRTDDYSVIFTKLDSTRHVTDSAIHRMRTNAEKNNIFNKGIKYGNTSKQYQYLKTKICIGKDTLNQTFYLQPDLTEVVAFK